MGREVVSVGCVPAVELGKNQIREERMSARCFFCSLWEEER